MTLRVGLIGYGRIGAMHAGLLTRFVDGAELAAVCEPIPAAARRAEAEMGVRTVEDEVALFESGIDAVAICSSTPTHARYIKMAAGAGIAAFCEKPISLDLAEAAEAVEAAESAGIPLVLGFNRRLDPGHRAVRDGVARGEIGTPWQVVIISRDPEPPPADYLPVSGGLFRDMAIHDLDMARYLLGEEVVEVNVTATSLVIPEAEALGDVDLAFISLRYESGALGLIVNSRAAAYGYEQRIEVNGSKGQLASGDPPLRHTRLATAGGFSTPVLQHFFAERYRESYIRQWNEFLALIRGEESWAANGRDGYAALALAEAAQRSHDTGRPVKVRDL
ncbi:MAG: inositol 2-dehydrogenase [Acidimicrobiia bacterium]|nr:inositol 2-dehydrogenase [bacterium]MXX00445.1 inositol 2-dehydrogenase [Acidimicrobiia bacterium]MXX45828.1 inositol 2-dehydrogenase [Acidimicrobiia bacterium]MXY74381.1 inositol 2-dehydrogenase [Acidimicrobiia bacterium]MYG92863.1 inositol 2-dehydrogenase [Acidimicrobiia bacterium]